MGRSRSMSKPCGWGTSQDSIHMDPDLATDSLVTPSVRRIPSTCWRRIGRGAGDSAPEDQDASDVRREA